MQIHKSIIILPFQQEERAENCFILIILSYYYYLNKKILKERTDAKSEAVPTYHAPGSRPFSPSPSTSHPFEHCDHEV